MPGERAIPGSACMVIVGNPQVGQSVTMIMTHPGVGRASRWVPVAVDPQKVGWWRSLELALTRFGPTMA
jgi:hypothetical protein